MYFPSSRGLFSPSLLLMAVSLLISPVIPEGIRFGSLLVKNKAICLFLKAIVAEIPIRPDEIDYGIDHVFLTFINTGLG